MIFLCSKDKESVVSQDIVLIQGENMADKIGLKGFEQYKNENVYLDFLLPKGRKFRSEMLTFSQEENIFLYDITNFITCYEGEGSFEIVIIHNNKMIEKYIPNNNIIMIKKAINATSTVPENKVPIIDNILLNLVEIENLLSSHSNLIENIEDNLLESTNKINDNSNDIESIQLEVANINQNNIQLQNKIDNLLVNNRELLYDKSNPEYDLGYPNGIAPKQSVKLDLSKYRFIDFYTVRANGLPTVSRMAIIDNPYENCTTSVVFDYTSYNTLLVKWNCIRYFKENKTLTFSNAGSVGITSRLDITENKVYEQNQTWGITRIEGVLK